MTRPVPNALEKILPEQQLIISLSLKGIFLKIQVIPLEQ
jgi:hypothetical protein